MESARDNNRYENCETSDLLSSRAILQYYESAGPAASRLRRRCRSEDLDRSNPYDDIAAYRTTYSADTRKPVSHIHNKSHFTCSEREHIHISCFPPLNTIGLETVNGDYLMDDQCRKSYRYSPNRSPKHRKNSPPRSILRNSPNPSRIDDSRLPKVEELLEKINHPEIMDFSMEPITKLPLKSILNNPIEKSLPPGILKKTKHKNQIDGRQAGEGRRRQRALSESEFNYANFEIHRSAMESITGRMPSTLTNMKRAKDNHGSGYSYSNPPLNYNGSPQSNQGFVSHIRHGNPKGHPAATGYKDCPNSQKEWQSGFNSQKEWQSGFNSQKEWESGLNSHRDWLVASNSPGDTSVQCANVLRTTSIGNQVEIMDTVVTQETPPLPLITSVIESQPPGSPLPSIPSAQLKKAARTGRKGKLKKVKVMKKKTEVPCDVDVEEPRLSPSPPQSPSFMDTERPRNGREVSLSPVRAGQTDEQPSVKKLSDKLTNGAAVSRIKKNKDPPLLLPDGLSHCVRLSLFPRVPPYLRFISHDDNPPLKPPVPVQKHLKWKLTTITPIVVKKTLINSGFKLVKSECDTSECPQEETVDWIGIWGKHMKSVMFRAIKDGQKMNHFPGTFQIGRKDRLWRNLQKLASKYGKKEFGIMPKTYVLPHDMKILKHEWEKYAARGEKWIIKPPASARGTGIKVISRWTQIPKKRAVVVQRYVAKPYLINGSKFDMRLYVLVTSMHPLRIYLFNDGLARFASVKYSDEQSSLHDRYMHLTNYSINRLSKNYTANEDANACQGHKWTLQALLQYLKTERGVDTDALWGSMKDLVVKTIISGEASISSLTKANIASRYNCYELFGIDVLLDEDLKPWLLEVNISPSLHSASPLDLHVKGPLVTSVLNIAQFQIPSKTSLETVSKEKQASKDKLQNLKYIGVPYDGRLYTVYLSKEERDKHIIYTKMDDRDEYLSDILSTLTPDDLRHLIQAEDELTQVKNGMERIFPTSDTHKYLGYLSGPRYYNRLFDAWETKYKHNRIAGIDLLRSLCDIGYHLEVPPVPLKRAAAPELAWLVDGCRMTWTPPRHPLRSARPKVAARRLYRSKWSRRRNQLRHQYQHQRLQHPCSCAETSSEQNVPQRCSPEHDTGEEL